MRGVGALGIMMRYLQCYARGVPGHWEAICVDLDIAVQGRSFDEVKQSLNRAIETYIEDAMQEPPEVACKLLSRRAPFYVRARYAIAQAFYALRKHPRNGDGQAGFSIPCHG